MHFHPPSMLPSSFFFRFLRVLRNTYISFTVWVLLFLLVGTYFTTRYGERFKIFESVERPSRRWAVLVAGSKGWINYRHQADVCHAYQVLKRGGLDDEHIIVFMYDDIAYNEYNPRPGIIINSPSGDDVYSGVPKDYTGEHASTDNFIAVIEGRRWALSGGSGKVVDSGPNDYIFIYYSGHGASTALGMPDDSVLDHQTLKYLLWNKKASGGYMFLLLYLEACHSGGILPRLPKNLDIYVTTAANASGTSQGKHCPFDPWQRPPQGYGVCIGNHYSSAWMENSERCNLRTETLHQQFKLVQKATRSNVLQGGDDDLGSLPLSAFMGTDPRNDEKVFFEVNPVQLRAQWSATTGVSPRSSGVKQIAFCGYNSTIGLFVLPDK